MKSICKALVAKPTWFFHVLSRAALLLRLQFRRLLHRPFKMTVAVSREAGIFSRPLQHLLSPRRLWVLCRETSIVEELPIILELMRGPLRTLRSLRAQVKEEDDLPDVVALRQITDWTFVWDGTDDDEILGDF